MTIDATKSPTSALQRYAVILLLAVMIVAAGYYLWTHELHKKSTNATPSAPANAPARSGLTQSPPTTVIAVSSRNPFSS